MSIGDRAEQAISTSDGAPGVSWKEYHDASSASIEAKLHALKEFANRVFEEQQKASALALAKVDAVQTAQQRAVEVALGQLEQRIQAVQNQAADRIDAMRREAKAALSAAELAISKSEVATERRFESVNEFRAQLSDQVRLFMPREVAEARIDDLRRTSDGRLEEIRSRMDVMQARLDQASGSSAGTSRSIGYMLTALGLTLSIIIVATTLLTK